MLELYTYYRSSASYRVRIALNLKGLDYKATSVHLRKGEQTGDAYTKINHSGLVPALVDDGAALSQSLAIIEYLDETHPQTALLPKDPADRAWVRALSQVIACEIHPLNNLRVLKYLVKDLGHDEATRDAWYRHWVALGFETIERMLTEDGKTGSFCFGDTPTLADVCLVPQVFNAERFDTDMTPYPTIRRINEACLKLDAFDKAAPGNQFDAE